MRTTITLVALALFMGACAANNNGYSGIQGLAPRDAETLNARHNKFDSASDPPFTSETHFAAGRLAESQGAIAQAVIQYKAAIKLDPKHANSLFQLGRIYTTTKQFPEAIDAWKQYIRATNDSASGYGNLAFCYEHAGMNQDAEQAYQEGLKRDPANRSCRVKYGLMLVRLGRVDEGRQQLSTVLKPAEVHYNIGSVYERQGKQDDAKSEYEKALDLDPGFTDARTRLSRID